MVGGDLCLNAWMEASVLSISPVSPFLDVVLHASHARFAGWAFMIMSVLSLLCWFRLGSERVEREG
jgi:hypothetical protein